MPFGLFTIAVEQARDIEVTISSAQVVGGIGALFILLLSLLGWFASRELASIKAQVAKTNDVVVAAFARIEVHDQIIEDLKQWRLNREDAHQRKNEEQVRILNEEIARLRARETPG